MNQQEWVELVESLRMRVGKPSNRSLGRILNQQYPVLAPTTLEGPEWIANFRYGRQKVRDAAYQKEPELSYLLLFLEQLKPTPDEQRKLFSYLEQENPAFHNIPILDYQI